MKRIFTKNLSLLVAVLTLQFLVFACNSAKEESANQELAIPELLQRSAKLQIGNEWQEVQNQYAAYKQKIEKNDETLPKLMMAELFVKEARITGEHGHYYPAALMMTESAITNEKTSPELMLQALIIKSGVQLSLHQFEEAAKTAATAYALNPANAQLLGVLVDANVELGHYDAAVKFADQMVSIRPDLRSYARVAYIREIFGDVEGSEQAMMMAVKAGYPGLEETSWAMHTLGEMFIRYGKADKAIDIFNAILEQRKDYPFAVDGLGQAYEQMGDFEKAEAYYKEAISILPEVGFNINLAKLYKKTNREKEALALAKDIVVMLTEDEKSGHVMDLAYADVYLNVLESEKDALHYAQKEYIARPENIEVNKVMADIYMRMDNQDQLKMHAEIAARTDSKDPEILMLKEKADLVIM